jgi:hypothetical protein
MSMKIGKPPFCLRLFPTDVQWLTASAQYGVSDGDSHNRQKVVGTFAA